MKKYSWLRIAWLLGCAVLALLLNGCSHGYNLETSYIPSSSQPRAANQGRLDLFFEGSTPPCAYEPIGMTIVEGSRYDRDELLIHKLRQKAWGNGADLVLEVKRSTRQREESFLWDEPKDVKVYEALVYTGLAAVYTDSSCGLKGVDSTFVKESQRIEAQHVKSEKMATEIMWVAMLLGVPLVLLGNYMLER